MILWYPAKLLYDKLYYITMCIYIIYVYQPTNHSLFHACWMASSWDKTTHSLQESKIVEVVGSPTHGHSPITKDDTETWQLNIWISTIYRCFPVFPSRKPPFQADLPGAIARWAAFVFWLRVVPRPKRVNKERRIPSGFSTYGKSPCLIGKVILN